MKIIVGLGNPGKQYVSTRHNVGFDLVAALAKQFGAGESRKKFHAEIMEAVIAGEKTLLMKPQTFMNLSGESVQPAVAFHKVELTDLLVLCDDFALPLGKLRLRAEGSAGGQNGLSDILRRLGTQQVPRLRLGIGPLPSGWDAANFVLGKFDAGERLFVAETVTRAVGVVETWIRDGIAKAMSVGNV